MRSLLPDDQVVEVDTLLVLLFDLADDGAEVLDILSVSERSALCLLKASNTSTPRIQIDKSLQRDWLVLVECGEDEY